MYYTGYHVNIVKLKYLIFRQCMGMVSNMQTNDLGKIEYYFITVVMETKSSKSLTKRHVGHASALNTQDNLSACYH